MHNDYSKKDMLVILKFINPPKGEFNKVKSMIEKGEIVTVSDYFYKKLNLHLKEFEAIETYKLKVIETDLIELEKEETVLESDFDKEFENFYQNRYEAIDKKIDEQYEKDIKKMDEIDQKVRESIDRYLESMNAELEQKKIQEIRKQLGKL